MKTLALLALLLISPLSHGALICSQCEYDNGSDGFFLGSFNGEAADRATFQLTQFERGRFNNFWVFDIGPRGAGVSVLAAALDSITLFAGLLFEDDGSDCVGSTCSDIDTGDLIDTEASLNGAWGMFNRLDPGRYVLRITGVIAPPRDQIYLGLLETSPLTIREAGTLGLFGLGLFGLAGISRWRRR